MKRILPFLLLLILSGPVLAFSPEIESEFVHCYDFGCKSTQNMNFSPQQWITISNIFAQPALSAWLEKQQIRKAIAQMESYSGQITGTSVDKGGNYPGENLAQQQDCIDESTNTMQYLYALQNRKLMSWHQVDGKKRRIVWFATHWTAVIKEIGNSTLYAVDSWYRDNGEPPYIQQLSDWQRKRSFSDLLNP